MINKVDRLWKSAINKVDRLWKSDQKYVQFDLYQKHIDSLNNDYLRELNKNKDKIVRKWMKKHGKYKRKLPYFAKDIVLAKRKKLEQEFQNHVVLDFDKHVRLHTNDYYYY